MGTVQKVKSFNSTGVGATNPLQTAEAYLLGTQNVSTSSAGTDIAAQTPNTKYAQDPTIMASAWDLPPNLGALRLATGTTGSVPVDGKTATKVSDGIEMLNLYDKLDAGTPLTHADVVAATRLGGPVARAAQLAGTPGVVSTGKAPKGLKGAIVDAKNELATRLHATVGIPADILGKGGMNAKVPQNFAATMQNAGYAVTKNMTVKQALTAAQSVIGGSPAPTSVQSNQTVAQYIQGLGKMSKDQLYSLQQNLFNGGFYDDAYYGNMSGSGTKEYTQGVLDTGTTLAFRKAILQTLVDQKAGKTVNGQTATLDDVISAGQNSTLASAPGAAGSATGVKPPATQPLATEGQTQAPLINAFIAALGRNPTQQELAKFTQSYQGQLTAGDKALQASGATETGATDLSSGIPFVPGTPTVAGAATNYAQTQDPTEYQGHNVANAFGMLMNLVDRAGVSSLNTPGTRPTTTT